MISDLITTGRYIDLVDGKVDKEAETLRENLRQVRVPEVVPKDQLFKYAVEWVSKGVDYSGNAEHKRLS